MGYLWGFIGVLIFSFTLPATRLTSHVLDPVFVGLGRSALAGILALVVLVLTRSRLLPATVSVRVGIVAVGVVFGFPLFTSFAMQKLPASHGAVVVGLLPLATAVAAAWLAHEKYSRLFLISSIGGSLCVVLYSLYQSNWYLGPEDFFLFCAVLFAALGYAEGGRLSREYGGWRVISWALVLSLPITVFGTILTFPRSPEIVPASAWVGLGYTAVFSMFLGFFAWYHGLAQGGIARVGQLQLLQPFLTIFFSCILLSERLDIGTVLVAMVVVGFVFLGRWKPKTA